MSDAPLPALGGKTPLEAARAPAFATLAARADAEVGRFITVPEGFKANSDVANLGLLGLDPSDPAARGAARGPMEAAAAGISLGSGEIAYRANLVVLGGDPAGPLAARILADFTGGHVSTDRARELVARVAQAAAHRGMTFHAGVQYRHLLVLEAPAPAQTFAAHEEVERRLGEIRPSGPRAEDLWAFVEDSARILAPENLAFWPWGGGRAMSLPRIAGGGVVITAVDLIRGLGRLRGLEPIDVPGATGWLVPPRDPQALAGALDEALALGAAAREALARRAIAHVAGGFTREIMCARTIDLYEELLFPEAATLPVWRQEPLAIPA